MNRFPRLFIFLFALKFFFLSPVFLEQNLFQFLIQERKQQQDNTQDNKDNDLPDRRQ